MESAEGLKRLLNESGVSVESDCARQMLQYLSLLEKWNSRINLTSARDWDALEALFREAVWASGMYPSAARTHLDIGSGAGFPAIILRILNPGIQLEMVESRGKKAAFLETLFHALNLNEARVYPERLGMFLSRSDRTRVWDCISWKGLRLNSHDLLQLRKHTQTHTQLWMFHGKYPAIEDPAAMKPVFKLIRREKFPAREESYLSIYLPL